jgi:hypothetical protein
MRTNSLKILDFSVLKRAKKRVAESTVWDNSPVPVVKNKGRVDLEFLKPRKSIKVVSFLHVK